MILCDPDGTEAGCIREPRRERAAGAGGAVARTDPAALHVRAARARARRGRALRRAARRAHVRTQLLLESISQIHK